MPKAKPSASQDQPAGDQPAGLAGKKAAAKAAKARASGTPDPALVARVTDEVVARATSLPAGVQAAPGDFAARLRKAVPLVMQALGYVGAIAVDGQFSADEVRMVAADICALLKARLGGSPTSAPEPTGPRAA